MYTMKARSAIHWSYYRSVKILFNKCILTTHFSSQVNLQKTTQNIFNILPLEGQCGSKNFEHDGWHFFFSLFKHCFMMATKSLRIRFRAFSNSLAQSRILQCGLNTCQLSLFFLLYYPGIMGFLGPQHFADPKYHQPNRSMITSQLVIYSS